eukprot:UN02491
MLCPRVLEGKAKISSISSTNECDISKVSFFILNVIKSVASRLCHQMVQSLIGHSTLSSCLFYASQNTQTQRILWCHPNSS